MPDFQCTSSSDVDLTLFANQVNS